MAYSTDFAPDYTHIQAAAWNRKAARLPLYEHTVSDKLVEQITGKSFRHLLQGDLADKTEYFRHYCGFFKAMGYDSLSFEGCIGFIMPDSGCLGGHKESVIHNRADFEKYPWAEIPDLYFAAYTPYFEALRAAMPDGMKAVGGVGNGVFECVQEVIGYMNLCYIAGDDPALYEDIFRKTGEVIYTIWQRFLPLYHDIYGVLRFGDDLGFKSNTLISADDIRRLIVPEYQRIIAAIHAYQKPFLLHSCGCIFDIMPDMIYTAKIDAKHSNEDAIARFPVWVERYGAHIGNFGGIDTDAVCRLSETEIDEYVRDVLTQCADGGGIAFGSGNSIPDYVPPEKYVAMIEAVRRYRNA